MTVSPPEVLNDGHFRCLASVIGSDLETQDLADDTQTEAEKTLRGTTGDICHCQQAQPRQITFHMARYKEQRISCSQTLLDCLIEVRK